VTVNTAVVTAMTFVWRRLPPIRHAPPSPQVLALSKASFRAAWPEIGLHHGFQLFWRYPTGPGLGEFELSLFRIGQRDQNTLHRSRSVDELTLKDDQIERPLDCFSGSRRSEGPLRSA
jgi:hypothetical protein